jgi:hypothetical protein
MRHRLYKYYPERKWAEAFLEGEILFRALSFFRNYEDANVRKDRNEGVSRYRPPYGLVGYNHTQGRSFTLPNHGFESSARAQEIFVFCVSTVFGETLRARFDAVTCVEILKIREFCDRIRAALPTTATFFARRVQYCKPTDLPEARWALPDLIATSKFDDYSWQSEYRFVFSLTDALGFEKVTTVLRSDHTMPDANAMAHSDYPLKTRSLGDICRLREFATSTESEARLQKMDG